MNNAYSNGPGNSTAAYKLHIDLSSLSSVKIEDLSLYRNAVMVRDRIWVPNSITLNVFNNLHLGHRAIDMMKQWPDVACTGQA